MATAFAGRSRENISVFAYGALMWRPVFAVSESRMARLPDHARRLSVWSALARGTPRNPGLAFGLEPATGTDCVGKLLRMEQDGSGDGLDALWEMEMHTGIYRPVWVTLEGLAGPEEALTFVVQPSHPQYAGVLAPEERARHVASAAGKFGRCRDYLYDAVTTLRGLGAPDAELEDLLRRVDELGD